MAEIPGFGAFTGDGPRPSTSVAQVSHSGDVGDAIARLGGVLVQRQDQQNELDYATARSRFLQNEVGIRSSFDKSSDPKTMVSDYSKQVGAVATQTADGLATPQLRQRFMAETGLDIARGAADMKTKAFGLQTDQGRATLDDTLTKNREAALSDPRQAPAIIQSTQQAIEAARGATIISAVEAQKLNQDWVQSYGIGRANTLPPAERFRVLTGRPVGQPNYGGGDGPVTLDDVKADERSGVTSVSPKGAAGTWQMMPGTAKDAGVDPAALTDPKRQDEVQAGAQKHLDTLNAQFGSNRTLVLAAWNAGPQAVNDWINGTDTKLPDGKHTNPDHERLGDPRTGETTDAQFTAAIPFDETRNYVARGTGTAAQGDIAVADKTGTWVDFIPLDKRAEMARTAQRQAHEDMATGRQKVLASADDDVAWLRSGGDPSKIGTNPQTLMAVLGPEDGTKAVAVLEDAKKYGASVRSLALAPQAEVDRILSAAAPGRTQSTTTQDQAFQQNSQYVKPGAHSYNTALAAPDEKKFRDWVTQNKIPFDPSAKVSDYDMRGFWKALQAGDPKAKAAVDQNDGKIHYPDFWKTPYHATFSNESQWAKPGAPHWTADDRLVTSEGATLFDDRSGARDASGFRAREQNFQDLKSIAVARDNALNTDPAGYVIHNDPATLSAYAASRADPGKFGFYVQRLNAVYDLMGVPSRQRQIIPTDDAKAVVTQIENGVPGEAAKLLSGLRETSGKYWPQVYGAIARNGLPGVYQAASIAAPQDGATIIAALQHAGEKGGLPAFAKSISDDDKQTLDDNLNGNSDLQSLQDSLGTYGRAGVDGFSSIRTAVRTTALYLMAQTPGLAPDAAAERAAAMITSTYDFMPNDQGHTARISLEGRTPGQALAQAQDATRAALDGLGPHSVMPYAQEKDASGATIHPATAQLAQDALANAKSAWWMTVTLGDGRQGLRAMDPSTNSPVRLSTGKTLDVVTSPMRAPASPSQRSPIPAPANAPPLPKGIYRLDEAVRRGARQPAGAKLPVAR